jgi:hypothetical protein
MKKRLQRLANAFVIGLLRSPLHRVASGSLLTVTYYGRGTGRRSTIPAMYAEREGTLTIFVGRPEGKTWWRNLRDGAAVEVVLRGHRLGGQATVVHDATAAVTYVGRYPRARSAVEAGDAPTFVRIGALRRLAPQSSVSVGKVARPSPITPRPPNSGSGVSVEAAPRPLAAIGVLRLARLALLPGVTCPAVSVRWPSVPSRAQHHRCEDDGRNERHDY